MRCCSTAVLILIVVVGFDFGVILHHIIMAETDWVIGIDLGTTNSCAAYYKDNKIIVLENVEGDRKTPSIVYYRSETNIVVGQSAKDFIEKDPRSGVYEPKRLMGKSYNDPSIKKFMELVPYGITESNAEIELEIFLSKTKKIYKQTPVDVSSHVLKKLKNDIEDKLGHKIINVVITIPAYFNVRQREATFKAGELAGFKVLKLLNEPTAAALTYFYEIKNCPNNKYYLVYDLGGGTFDVSILKKTENEIKVIAIDGSTSLGGCDFDNIFLQHIIGKLKNKYNYSINDNKKLFRHLQNKCEKAKKELSTQEQTSIIIIVSKPPSLVSDDTEDEDDITIDVTRYEFEELCIHLFNKTLTIVKSCLTDAKLTQNDIQEIILCGGSTRIPKLQNMLTTFFNGKKLRKVNNLDECVAEGAALQAAMLSQKPIQKTVPLRIIDVVSLSIGVATSANLTDIVIQRNSPLPVSKNCTYHTTYNKQKSIIFRICEGERADARKNYFLGSLILDNLTPAPPGECKIILKFALDMNGILTLTATETVCDNTKTIKIDYNKQHDNSIINYDNELDARENKDADEFFRKFAHCFSYIKQYCIGVKFNITEKKLKNMYRDIYEYCSDIEKSLQNMTVKNYEELINIKTKLRKKCEKAVNVHQFKHMPLPK